MYLIDGYNLLFTLTESDHPLARQRDKIIHFFQKRFAALKISGMIVFDGKIRHGEESGRSYPSPLEVVYTSKGQSADEFIVEKLEMSSTPRQIFVVTNDRGLIANVRSIGAKVVNNAEFIEKLLSRKKTATSSKTEVADSKQNIARLLAIFERKLSEEENS